MYSKTEEIAMSTEDIMKVCSVACTIAEKHDYSNKGTASVNRKPTNIHLDITVVGVASRDASEEVHVVMKIVHTGLGRRLRTIDVHEGRCPWGNNPVCEECDKAYRER